MSHAALLSASLPQVLALFEKAPSTEARRNLFCIIFDAAIAQQIEVLPCADLERRNTPPFHLCNVLRCRNRGILPTDGISFYPDQGTGEADIRTLGRLFTELNIADALQPVFQCGKPDFVKHIAAEISIYLDTLRVRPAPS